MDLNRKFLIFVFLVTIVLFSASVLGISWQNFFSNSRQLAQGSVVSGGEWGFSIYDTFPKNLNFDKLNLTKNQGFQLFVKDPNNVQKNVVEIYTGDVDLWDAGSWFAIRGASVYSDFPEQKFDVSDLVKEYGGDNVYNKKLDYYFPSEDRKILKIEIEVDTTLGDELIVYKVYLLDSATFFEDLALLKDNKKVPVGSQPPSSNLLAVLEVNKTTGNKPLTVVFDISKSTASTGKTIEKYELDFGDDTPKQTGVWPTTSTGLNDLKLISHIYQTSSVAKLTITEKDTGETAEKSVTITVGVAPVSKGIVESLANISKSLVDDLDPPK